MKFTSIQFLRAIAALLVVYAGSVALQTKFALSNQQNFYHLQNFGGIGADIFFIISGFIITYMAYNYHGASQGTHFLTKRFFRINPAYYTASLFYFGVSVLQYLTNHSTVHIQLDKTINKTIDTLLILPSSGKPYNYNPFLPFGWTLSFVWLFYVLFFFLILSKTRYKTLFLSTALISLVLLGQLVKANNYLYYFITNPVMLEFVLGILICWLFIRLKTMPKFIPSTCIIIGLVSYIALVRYGYGRISGYTIDQVSMQRFLIWGIPSGLLVAGCVFMEKNHQLNRLWSNKWMQLIGDASYSIYLVHATIFVLLTMLYKKTGFFLNPDLVIWLQMLVVVVASLGFYKWVEKPLVRVFSKKATANTPSPIPFQPSLQPEASPIAT
jgi:exopolysaccharide production protein ExoZ